MQRIFWEVGFSVGFGIRPFESSKYQKNSDLVVWGKSHVGTNHASFEGLFFDPPRHQTPEPKGPLIPHSLPTDSRCTGNFLEPEFPPDVVIPRYQGQVGNGGSIGGKFLGSSLLGEDDDLFF